MPKEICFASVSVPACSETKLIHTAILCDRRVLFTVVRKVRAPILSIYEIHVRHVLVYSFLYRPFIKLRGIMSTY